MRGWASQALSIKVRDLGGPGWPRPVDKSEGLGAGLAWPVDKSEAHIFIIYQPHFDLSHFDADLHYEWAMHAS